MPPPACMCVCCVQNNDQAVSVVAVSMCHWTGYGIWRGDTICANKGWRGSSDSRNSKNIRISRLLLNNDTTKDSISSQLMS